MDVVAHKDRKTAAAPHPMVADISFRDLWEVLGSGWRDFATAPLFGIGFAAVYVSGGLFLAFVSAGLVWQTLILALGFPLFAPFAAVGVYEVSRRIETGQPLQWRAILSVIIAEKNRQIPWLGGLIVVYFLFYSFLAHMIFALFMGFSTITNVSSSFEMFLTSQGLVMIAVEMVVGAVLGLLLFALTVVSLPLCLDKEIDFVSAMILSVQTVLRSPATMLIWAIVIGGTMLLAMLPAFLGLFVALPVFGHASWHLYRRVLEHPEQ